MMGDEREGKAGGSRGRGRGGDDGGENTVAAPVNRTAYGRLFSDLANFKDVYAKPARWEGEGGMVTREKRGREI